MLFFHVCPLFPALPAFLHGAAAVSLLFPGRLAAGVERRGYVAAAQSVVHLLFPCSFLSSPGRVVNLVTCHVASISRLSRRESKLSLLLLPFQLGTSLSFSRYFLAHWGEEFLFLLFKVGMSLSFLALATQHPIIGPYSDLPTYPDESCFLGISYHL